VARATARTTGTAAGTSVVVGRILIPTDEFDGPAFAVYVRILPGELTRLSTDPELVVCTPLTDIVAKDHMVRITLPLAA
jgi:hypothetical protein